MTNNTLLDNPVWHALTSRQRPLNRGSGAVARYPADCSRFMGLERPTPHAFEALSAALQPGETAALVTAEPVEVGADFETMRVGSLVQMVCERLAHSAPRPDLSLTVSDVPEMLALARLTEPGPFMRDTIEMGRYFGVRSPDGNLVAMAGERMRLVGHTEISAVCTHPDFRGRGCGKLLVAGLSALAFDEGCMPFLHVRPDNGARLLYEALGFRARRTMQLTVIAKSPSA